MNILHQAARRLERLEALDKVARPLTDLPIGAWAMSALDAAGGPAAEGPPTFWSPSAWWPPRRPRLPG